MLRIHMCGAHHSISRVIMSAGWSITSETCKHTHVGENSPQL